MKPKVYRDIIDALVRAVHHGQGNIGARRVIDGVWNQNATSDFLEDQHAINLILEKLTAEERKALAQVLTGEVITGVFETLKVLEEYEVEPFLDGYEGSPFEDFIGRVDKDDPWPWPEE